MGYFLLIICGTEGWHYKWRTAQTKDIFTKIQKRLPEEVRYKIHSFHLLVCFGTLIGDRLLCYNHVARGNRGCPQAPCIHVIPPKDGDGISRRRCTKSHFHSNTWGQHIITSHSCKHHRDPCQGQMGRWMEEAVSSTPRGCSSLCAGVMQSAWLYAVVWFWLSSADSLYQNWVMGYKSKGKNTG